MPVSLAYQTPYLYELDIEVDGKRADYLVGQMKITRTYNQASTLTLQIVNRAGIDLFKIGSVVRLVGSRGVGDSIGSTGATAVKNLRFDGFVRIARPTETGVVVTIADPLTLLAIGEVQNYNSNDYIGEDLYYIARGIMENINDTNTDSGDTLGYSDAYGGKWLDTSNLYQGSGIDATADMDIWGFQTPKAFIDGIFNEMYKRVDGAAQKDNEYDDAVYFFPWRYGVFSSNIVTYYYNDTFLKTGRATHTISEETGTLLAGGIIAQIDTTRTINNCTATSSSDDSISANFKDTHSIRKYGDVSKQIELDTTEYDTLNQAAYRLVQLYREPTYSYTVRPTAQDLYLPGDIVNLTAPTAGLNLALPVEEVEVVIGNGTIESTIVVGQRMLPVDELVQKLAA